MDTTLARRSRDDTLLIGYWYGIGMVLVGYEEVGFADSIGFVNKFVGGN